jgi:hypothetical protein
MTPDDAVWTYCFRRSDVSDVVFYYCAKKRIRVLHHGRVKKSVQTALLFTFPWCMQNKGPRALMCVRKRKNGDSFLLLLYFSTKCSQWSIFNSRSTESANSKKENTNCARAAMCSNPSNENERCPNHKLFPNHFERASGYIIYLSAVYEVIYVLVSLLPMGSSSKQSAPYVTISELWRPRNAISTYAAHDFSSWISVLLAWCLGGSLSVPTRVCAGMHRCPESSTQVWTVI